MNSTTEATTLTNTLLTSVRMQRHSGTRIFISTQEPTVSPQLLDLCSTTIVHRFTSPAWLQTLKSHLAGVSLESHDTDTQTKSKSKATIIFEEIVKLRIGEALIFCPSAIIGVEGEGATATLKKLGTDHLKVKIRARITQDGGQSVMA